MGVTADFTTKRYTTRKYGRQVKLEAYQLRGMITGWKCNIYKHTADSGLYVRSLWNGGNPG
jgi:hypothetical protein